MAPPWLGGRWLQGGDYLVHVALPNFFFHVTMAYAILRHNGVPLGKTDYIGSMPTRGLSKGGVHSIGDPASTTQRNGHDHEGHADQRRGGSDAPGPTARVSPPAPACMEQ